MLTEITEYAQSRRASRFPAAVGPEDFGPPRPVARVRHHLSNRKLLGSLAGGEGSLYPALHRLEEAGWIRAEWTITENKRRARIYEITIAGRKELLTEESRWTSVTAAIGQVLGEA